MSPNLFTGPLRTAVSSSRNSTGVSRPSSLILHYLRALNAAPTALSSVRHASHQAQGRANGPKATAGRRLGAKKSGEQYVVPGNIIFRQRGTHWFPGENCDMGRDHTIFATEPGFVKYYRDPIKHPKRQYIGVVFERHQALPTPPNAARRRRLGMVASPMPIVEETPAVSPVPETESEHAVEAAISLANFLPGTAKGKDIDPTEPFKKTREGNTLKMRPNYQFREANWEIGRAAEKTGVVVREFERGDRFLAWRKTTARKARTAEKRSMGRGGKKGKAKPKKK
ncbi:ribosomal protein L27 [Tothia fuscella]|uniref:Large ribosomal subunit protein bL27m n=1 Tax=Tothia fuscella TaxID=1048955 RepID=A0A9P4P3S0_9PEZI|nr:ribosomal protein L27 [Tothia fuscella]